MNGIRIELTHWQYEMLNPLFDLVKKKHDEGRPGGLFAQIWPGAKGRGFLEVVFASDETCRAIQAVTGQEIGKIANNTVDVLIPDPEHGCSFCSHLAQCVCDD